MAGGDSLTTGVWWDLNTCPVPAGVHPRHVRPSIESALREYIGPGPVTIFAVGNLEYISPNLLEAISSTGILLRHFPYRGRGLSWLLHLWRRRNLPPGKILLISGDSSWFPRCFNNLGYTLLGATPEDCRRSPFPAYTCDKEWDWKSLLKENSVYVEKSILTPKDEPAWFCNLCEIPSQSCNDFIKHLLPLDSDSSTSLQNIEEKRSIHLPGSI